MAGHHVQSVAILQFVFEIGRPVLQHALEHPAAYSGIIITSPRAIDAIVHLRCDAHVLTAWHKHPVFVVGAASADRVAADLHWTVTMPAAPTAGDLAAAIVAHLQHHGPLAKPLLFLCAPSRRAELPDTLRQHQVCRIHSACHIVDVSVRCRLRSCTCTSQPPATRALMRRSSCAATHKVSQQSINQSMQQNYLCSNVMHHVPVCIKCLCAFNTPLSQSRPVWCSSVRLASGPLPRA